MNYPLVSDSWGLEEKKQSAKLSNQIFILIKANMLESLRINLLNFSIKYSVMVSQVRLLTNFYSLFIL